MIFLSIVGTKNVGYHNPKSEIEKREFLAVMGQNFKLEAEIQVGVGARKQKHNEQPDVIAETLGAIIGAIYLDGEYDVTKYILS